MGVTLPQKIGRLKTRECGKIPKYRTGTRCHEDEQVTEAQIAFALRQAELGMKVDEVCRKLGVSEATFNIKISNP